MQRKDYIDICKVVAMFMVTWAHCAQQISGMMFPQLLVSKDSFISVNMAMFMIASGLVMNLPKMRTTPFLEFLYSKVLRLLVPMTVWYFLFMMVLYPKRLGYWDAYWYLSAMFTCLVTIKVLIQVISSTYMISLISIIILFIMPFPVFERSCYMIPFLWVGYALRFLINRIDHKVLLLLVVLYGILYYFWDVRYSIYICPFRILDINVNSVISMIYRFAIGSVGGVAFIALIKIMVESQRLKWIRTFAKYGQYTLVFYTMSFVLNAILTYLMWHIGVYITTSGLLDFISCIISLIMMVIMYYFQKIVENNSVICQLLGVVYRKS